jgi:hypothetical protein
MHEEKRNGMTVIDNLNLPAAANLLNRGKNRIPRPDIACVPLPKQVPVDFPAQTTCMAASRVLHSGTVAVEVSKNY